MTTICKKCGWQVEKLDLSEETALEIWYLMSQDTKLYAVKKLIEVGIGHANAKGIANHYNPEFGKCHNCNYSELDKEYMKCPKCEAFNYNLKVEPPFGKDFCSALEYSLDFSQFEDENIKSLWCDGVDHLPIDIRSLSVDNLKQKPFIKTRAWIGKNGQDIYEMTIHFGPKALSNYINRQDLNECIPDAAAEEWITIDTEGKQVEVRLR